jgi:hypothetical protein
MHSAGFTPKLKKVYEELKAQGKKFEVFDFPLSHDISLPTV